MDKNNIAQRWRLLSGEKKWEGLLEPLDTDLQKCLVHYGSMAQATYDAYILDPLSKNNGRCRFSKRHFFARTGLVEGNPFKYRVVKYIYAASIIGLPESSESSRLKPATLGTLFSESNWIGFVAVATDEGKKALGRRDILVSWRGTQEVSEWFKDFEFPFVPALEIIGKISKFAFVHSGFLSVYTDRMKESRFNKTSAREQVLSEVSRQMQHHKGEEMSITITGHSLGAAISVINAVDIACNGHNKMISCTPSKTLPVTVINFGCPKVGNIHFKMAVESLKDLHVLRVRNFPDLVHHVPAILGYFHVGEMLLVNNLLSRFLRFPVDVVCWHNLEVGYLHPLATANGVRNLRSLALVNKNSSALKSKYGCPIHWWRARNKGMIQLPNGSWVMKDTTDDEKVAESKM